MWNVFVVGFEPEYSYIEADLDFDNKSEAKEFAMLFSMDDYSVTLTKIG